MCVSIDWYLMLNFGNGVVVCVCVYFCCVMFVEGSWLIDVYDVVVLVVCVNVVFVLVVGMLVGLLWFNYFDIGDV